MGFNSGFKGLTTTHCSRLQALYNYSYSQPTTLRSAGLQTNASHLSQILAIVIVFVAKVNYLVVSKTELPFPHFNILYHNTCKPAGPTTTNSTATTTFQR